MAPPERSALCDVDLTMNAVDAADAGVLDYSTQVRGAGQHQGRAAACGYGTAQGDLRGAEQGGWQEEGEEEEEMRLAAAC